MQNDVKGTRVIRSLAFVLPRSLECIRKAKLYEPCEETVRHVVKSISGATTDYRSRFSNMPKNICCIRIPRDAFSKDLLDQLDTGKGFCQHRWQNNVAK